jgi:inosose dehydratase
MTQDTRMFGSNAVRFGITPTSWWNDDFLDMDIGISFEQCIDEMAVAGFEGCSVGHKYPSDPAVLRPALELRGLRVSEPWTSTYFTINAMEERTIAEFKQSLAFIKAMDGTDLVVAELGGSSHQQPIALVDNRPIFDDKKWDALCRGLNKLGEIAAAAGMRLCYHHHMGTGVQTRADIDRLAANTNAKTVFLLLDTGHLTFAGDDPLDCARTYAHRIKHVHLKNIRRSKMKEALSQRLSFHDAIEAGVFTVPGDPDGSVEFEPILRTLSDANYQGWLMVEAEQNPAKATPLKYARMAREYLKNVTGH